MCSSTPKTTPKLSAKTGGETNKIDCFQTKVFRALKQCVSERVPSWSSRCCSSRPTGCCGVAILWICAPIDLPKPRRQFFRVQVRCTLHLSLLSHKRQAVKVCVPLFLFDRRNKGDPNAQYNGSHVQFLSQGIEEGTPMRYVPYLLRHCLTAERQLS